MEKKIYIYNKNVVQRCPNKLKIQHLKLDKPNMNILGCLDITRYMLQKSLGEGY